MADIDFLYVHAEGSPGKPALIHGGSHEVVDFSTLNRRANRAAHVLSGLGCEPQDRAAIMSFNSIAGFEISNGLRRVSLVGVPVNYRLRGSEVSYLLNDSGARFVFADSDHVDIVDAARPEVKGDRHYIATGDTRPNGWLSYAELMDAAPDHAPEARNSSGGLGATMIYTSGTTGHPKGAWRPNGVNIENVLQVISIFELNQSDVHLMCGPGYHSAVSFFAALHQVLGATDVIQPKFEADGALDLIERHRVTTTFMAPTLLKRLVDAQERKPRDTSSLRALILGAAPCPHALKVRAEAVFGQVLWEFYGATETGINTVLRPEDQLRKPGSCGQAVPGQEIRLLDATGSEVPTGTPVGPRGTVPRSDSVYAVPAMSRWTHEYPSANSRKNMAALIVPAGRPPEFLMSATSDLISSLYSSHIGSAHPGSPDRSSSRRRASSACAPPARRSPIAGTFRMAR